MDGCPAASGDVAPGADSRRSGRSCLARAPRAGPESAIGTGSRYTGRHGTLDQQPSTQARPASVFVDASPALAAVAQRLHGPQDPPLRINRRPDIAPAELPDALDGAPIAWIDHTALPVDIARACTGLRHVVFLGTGARSYMDPEALARLGIAVHTIKGYGDTAVAESAFALMWSAARGLAEMDRAMRGGVWLRREGLQLTGKTLGLVGFGGIAAELARLALGCGLKVIAWNRSARAYPGVDFRPLDDVLAASDVVSLHLSLDDETRGFLSAGGSPACGPALS